MNDDLAPLRRHPAFEVANLLATYTHTTRDLVNLTSFLAVVAGAMATPINVEIVSGRPTDDVRLINRILDLVSDRVARIETYRQFRRLEAAAFEKNAAILVRGNHPQLFRDFANCTACEATAGHALPSLIRVMDRADYPFAPGTLRIMESQATREPGRLGQFLPSNEQLAAREQLQRYLSAARPTKISCRISSQLRAINVPEHSNIVDRMMIVFATLRCSSERSLELPYELGIELDDYQAVRALLMNLPLVPPARQVPSGAIQLAEITYREVHQPGYQLSLPDHSAEGHRWFTREDARRWSQVAYNTAKKHLKALEDDGLIKSTHDENNRERGKQLHFKFAAGRAPPFLWKNPFDVLPDLTLIETGSIGDSAAVHQLQQDCATVAQSQPEARDVIPFNRP